MKNQQSEQMRQQQNEARQLATAYPVLMDLLGRRKKICTQRLLGAYRDGKEELLKTTVAELFVVNSLIEEIDRKVDTIQPGEGN